MTNKDKDREAFESIYYDVLPMGKDETGNYGYQKTDSMLRVFLTAIKYAKQESQKEIESLKLQIYKLKEENKWVHNLSNEYRDKGFDLIALNEKANERIKVLELELSEEKKVVDHYADQVNNDKFRSYSEDHNWHGFKLARQRQAKRVEIN